MKANKKEVLFLIYSGILILTLDIVLATPYIYMTDDWDADEGTNTDEAIFVHYEILPETLGITDMDADFICYDWNDDGTYDNCYYDSDGCGSSCNTESCNYYSIPNNMNDDWKASCNIDYGSGGCRIGEDVSSRICGTCDGVDTSTEQQTYIDAIVYYDCDNSNSNRHYEDLSNDDFFVVKPKKYDCDDCSGCYSYSTYDYEGDFASSGETWADIKQDISCSTNKKCSEYFDDDLVYTATGSINNPCKWDDGQSCSIDSDCASNECVHSVCRPTDPYCTDGYCDAGETYSSCEEDCCDADCTDSGVICRSVCDGYNGCSFYNSATKSVCNGQTYVDTVCVDSNTYVDCCEGTATDCSSGYYCSSGSCSYCTDLCDNICYSSACYGADPDCDSSGNPTLTCCGDDECNGGETVASCPYDCCENDCTATYDSTCHSECDGLEGGGCSLTSGCNGYSLGPYCVDSDTRRTCCEGSTVDCAGNEYCSSGSCLTCSTSCDDQCQSSACYGTDPDCDANGNPTLECGDETDLAILGIIPIQVIPNVDMVKDKSGYVRVIVHNYGPLNATGKVNVTFDGSPLTPYNPANASKFILVNTNESFDFSFKPAVAGNNKVISANVTIVS